MIYPPLYHLALAAQGQGEDERAYRSYGEVLAIADGLGDRVIVGLCLVGFAECAVALGQPVRAGRLYGAFSVVLASVGMTFHPFNIRPEFHERYLNLMRSQLGHIGRHVTQQIGPKDVQAVIELGFDFAPGGTRVPPAPRRPLRSPRTQRIRWVMVWSSRVSRTGLGTDGWS
ncbi:MAG: hypothetical protein M3490_09180 [Chloroflexota bacterium]|nr:hypothetical protein [Chloroflexota bacterium]